MADTPINTETLWTNEALKLEAQRFVDSLKDEEFGFLWFFWTQWLRKKVFAYLINDNIRESAWWLFFKFTWSLWDKILSEKKKILWEKYPWAKAVWDGIKNKVDQLGSEVPVTAEASKASNALSSQVNEQRHNWSSASSDSKTPSTQSRRNTQLSAGQRIASSHWTTLPRERVQKTRDYIFNGWTFYSPSKWRCQWNQYRGVCSTWSFNVLRRLWFPKVNNSTEVDLTGDTLTKMWLTYIWEVNPKDPWKNWYTPQDWDTAVWPKFTRLHWKHPWKTTQHQATYINWHRVSDNIQLNFSCYPNEPYEPNVKIYRYNPNMNNIHYS